jgi:hypothetical protein
MGPMGAAPDGKEAMVATYPAGAIGGGSVWSYYSNVQPEVLQVRLLLLDLSPHKVFPF